MSDRVDDSDQYRQINLVSIDYVSPQGEKGSPPAMLAGYRKNPKRPARARRIARRMLVEQLEDRRVLATVTWDGGAGTDRWDHEQNWSSDQRPAIGDDVVIPGGNFVRLFYSTDVNQLHIEPGAELRMVSNSNVPNAITDFHGNLVVDGQLTVRGEVNLFGSVDIGVTGKLLGQAWMNTPGFPQTIDPGQLFLGVNGDIENQGEITLLSEGNYYDFFQRIQLTVNEGYVLHNSGTISIERPHHDQALTRMRYGLFGNIVNEGHVQADFFFSSNGGQWINRGSIQIDDYFAYGQNNESIWEMRGGTYVYDGGTLSGTGTIETDQLTFQVNLPYQHITGNLPEVFYKSEITGTETFIIPDGSGALFNDTDIYAPFRLDGWATFRGGSKIDGELFVSPTGILNVEAYVPQGVVDRLHNNAYPTITDGFTNFGEIIIWSRESSYNGGTQYGYISQLTVQNGPIINEGVIRTRAPVAELPINPFLTLSADVINHGQFIVEGSELRISPGSLTSDGEVIVHEGVRLIHNAGSYVQNGGVTRIERTSIEGSQGDPYEFNGGLLVGDGRVYIPSRVNGIVAPGFEPPFAGQSTGSLFLELSHQHVLSSGVFEIDIQGGNVGEYDTIRLSDLPINQGTLRLQTDPTADLPIGTTITPVSTDFGTFAPFAIVEGRLIDATKAWSVPTIVTQGSAKKMELSVITLDEATMSEILREEFNAGISGAAASLPDWFDASDDGLPGKQQGLGSSLRSGINSVATSIFPTITNTVTTLNDLRSELTAMGYSVECLSGDAACGTDLFRIGAANGTTGFNQSAATDPSALAGLSLVPDGVDLSGDLDWDGTLSTSNVVFGFGSAGFYLDQNSTFDLSVTGGGNVTYNGLSLSTGGLSIDFDGTLTVPSSKPVAASISLISALDDNDFSSDPNTLFNVTSSSEVQLDITHTLQPTGLTYDGIWQLRQDTSGPAPTLIEISGNVDYPTTDDWLASSIGVLGAAMNVLLGPEATDKFNRLALPLIADSQPADSAPNLIGINSSEFEAAESSWMDKLFGGVKTIFSFFQEDDPATRSQGSFGTEGDVLINAHTLRFEEQVDGSGVKIGVISTGADGLQYAQGTGDIPGPAQLSTFIDQENAYGGNGTAMLEVIHDIAPGADLAFASATDTRSFFDAVTWLTDIQNVDIIVSDVIDYSAPMFGTSAVAAFVEDVLRRKNVLFVQAAGNDGEKAVRDQLKLINVDDNGNNRRLHQFGGTPADPVTTLPVTLAPESVVRVVLQTNQRYNNPTARIVAGVAALPDGVQLSRIGFPLGSTGTRDHEIPLTVDSFTLANHGDSPINLDVLIESIGGELPAGVTPLFQLVVLGDATLPSTNVGSLFGVSLLDDVLVVGANEISAPQQPAAYSSEGFPLGRRVDVAAPAGVETSGFGRRIWSDFHGTSSSAAHAAAAAALMMQWAPAATPLELREALKSTAKPIGSGVGDPRSGHGQIDVLEAASALIRIPDPGIPGPPPGPGLLDKLLALPIISSISLPTEQQLEQLLSGGEVLLAGLLEMRLTVNESLGVFKADYPFDFDGIGSFDQFEISGKVGLEAKPDINLQMGWDTDGWYIDVGSARVAADITGVGQAQGVVFDAFGVGAGATVTGRPYLDLVAIDRAGDGEIRQDDINQLSADLQVGDVSLVIPKLDTVNADLYGDVILGFLDYVDIDRSLPNRPNGGDPFIIRGRAKFNADFTGPQPQWSFGDFQLANPDIDGDEKADYTLGALAQNAILFGEKLINAIELPSFVNDLLGGAGLGGDRNETPYDRPRGMLPDELPEAPESVAAKQSINAHIQSALTQVNNDGSSVDKQALEENIRGDLQIWLEGTPPPAPGAGEGEAFGSLSILERLEVLQRDITRPKVDLPNTPQDEFEDSLNLALSSYFDWIGALQAAELQPEDVTDQATIDLLHSRLIGGLRHAIERSHAGAIELHLQGAPLHHQFTETQQDGETVFLLSQRGVIDRAIDAVRWAQTAEYLNLATTDNGLTVRQALDDFVIQVNIERATLAFPDDPSTDGYIGADESANFELETTWQIKTPPAGVELNIDDLASYSFGSPIKDSAGNIEVYLSGDGNNNVIAGEKVQFDLDPVKGIPNSNDILPIVRGRTDGEGAYRTSVKLGDGDTQLQLQFDVGLEGIPFANATTNIISGRPEIELLGALISEDDSALRSSRIIVAPGGQVALQARIRRGNGPFASAPLAFFLDGDGSLDQIDVVTTAQIPRTDSEGIATVYYTAPQMPTGKETVGVSFFEKGQFFKSTIEIIPSTQYRFSGYQVVPPYSSEAPSDDQDAEDARQSISDALADAEFANIEQMLLDELTTKVTTWKSLVAQKADDALFAAQDLNTADDAAGAMVSAAVSDYFNWLSYATLIEQGDVLAEEAIEAKLLSASDLITLRFLSQFDGSAANGGLDPLYDALEWATTVEHLSSLRAVPIAGSFLDPDDVIDQSGIKVELLPPISTSTSVQPLLTGSADDAALHVAARLVREVPGGGVVPVMQSGDIPAPVEIRVLPYGQADIELDLPAPQRPEIVFDASTQLRKGLLGAQQVFNPASIDVDDEPIYVLDHAPQVMTASAHRGPNDVELSIEISLGIPGILLEQFTATLRDAPDLLLLAAPGNGDDSDLQKDLYIPGGETAFLQTSLRRHDIPLAGDLSFNVLGGGTLNQFSGSTDQLGIVGGIEFLPPALPPSGVNATEGVSVIVVSYREDGKVHTDSIQIAYSYTGVGDNGSPIGTTDYVRANQELERALVNVTDIRPQTNFPDVDLDALGLLATEILRDWFMIDANDPAGEGSVMHWLQQIQSPGNGGAYPLVSALDQFSLDGDYRHAFDDAVENWARWFEVAKQLDIDPNEIVTTQQLDQAQSLLLGAYQHAIDRVRSNCQLLAQRYRDAPESTQQERDLKELYLIELLAEGDQALRYYVDLQSLAAFFNDDAIAVVEGIPEPGDLCYQIEIVDAETELIGTTESAQVRVKAGIRVDGVAELVLPPVLSPLVVQVRPLGNATVSGAIGRTDAGGVFDAAHVSAGSGDELLVVDVDVVFDFGRTLAYTSKRLTLNSVVRFIPSIAKESQGFGGLHIVGTTETTPAEPIELVDRERAIVELRFTKGKTPLIGKRVNIVTLGGGNLYGVHPVTDASGRIRFAYRPPTGVGRARIAYSYQDSGETVSNSVVIDYTTTREGQTEIDVPFSEANLAATSEAGLYLAGVGLNLQVGGTEVVDLNLLTEIQRTWLDSGVNPDGTINPDEPSGLRSLIIQANEAPIGLHIKQGLRAVFEYERWNSNNQTLGVVDALAAEESAVLTELVALVEATIDRSETYALENRSAVVAKDALDFSTQAKLAGLIDDDSPYERVQLAERLGYEIRVEEARLHGDVNDGWLQVVANIYLSDVNNPGEKVRAESNTPLVVDLVPKGFKLATLKETTNDGLFSSKVYMIDGDTDLELVVQVYDEFAASPLIEVDAPGKFNLDAGVRLESSENGALSSSLTLFAGQQAHLEGIVSKGLGRVGYRTVLVHVDGAPADSVVLTDPRTNGYLFTPPAGQTGLAVITLTLQAGEQLLQKSVTVNFSDQPAPEGEHVPGHAGSSAGNGLLNNEHAVGAFNEVNIPLAGQSDETALGNAFGLSSFQFPFSGGLPSASEFRSDLGNWFSESFDLLHIADMGTLVGLLNGLPAQPEEIVRIKFDASKALLPLSPAALAADFSGLLPDGFAGSLRVDRPEIDGQVVFGLDTSNSPFYVLTKPDRLVTNQPSLTDFLNGGTENAVRAGREATELTAKFGVAATFNSTEDLIDGVLQVPHADGYLSSVVKVDFSEVAIDTGKLRFDNLAELANLKIGFDGSPIDTFQAIANASVTLPNLSGINDDNHPLGNIEVVGAIHNKGDVWEFQLRTADLFELPDDIRGRLTTATVDLAVTPERETDDRYEPNDSSKEIQIGSNANLGLLVDRITLGGQDPANSDDVLALNDDADWFRFETAEVGNASSFVQVDFDSSRGDLDLALYRLVDSELQHVRTDGLSFGDQARLTLLGLPAGIYFVQVFDDAGGLSPFYSLTIDSPGHRAPGIEVNIGDFHVVDTALEINVDSNLEFSGFLGGRMVMTFGEQNGIPVELGFRAEIDTVADDPNENGGLHAEIATRLGGQSISTLGLTDGQGNQIVPPSRGIWSTRIDRDLGGYLIFDYQSATDFKFAGLDAANNRWVMGHYDTVDGWVVPEGIDWRKPVSPSSDQTVELRLFYQGRDVELWVGSEQESAQRLFVQTFADNIDGSLALGTPDGSAKFFSVSLTSGTLTRSGDSAVGWPSYDRTVFYDSFSITARPQWQLQKGVWRVEDDGAYTARSTSIELSDWLLVDSANVVGYIDIQFNDNDILVAPALNPTSEDEGSLSIGINLTDVNALLFKVADGTDGTPLYEDQPDSPKGLVAINDGFLTIQPDGVRLGAGRASAGIQDVLFVDIDGAQINLTTDPNEPLLITSDIGIRIPALSDTGDFVTISGQDTGQPIFGLSKPTLADPIPEFLLMQDGITIDFAVGQIQEKLDIGEVFPFTLESIGIRFNDAGNTAGHVSNFADFDLLVTGQVNFENSIFGNLPFDPIFAVGQPILWTPTGEERQVKLSSPSAYSEVCTDPISATVFPDFEGLCQNGFVSAELHLGALLGDEPDLFLRNIGPFYVGFENLSLFGDSDPVGDPQDAINGALKLHGLIRLGGFEEGKFMPDIFGSLAVTGTGKDGNPNEESTLGSLTVSGNFVGPHLVNDQGTTETSDDEYQSSLVLDWIGQASGQLGDRFNVSATDASVRIHTEFINSFTETDPFNLSVVIEPQEIDSGNLCVNFGPYMEICGSAVVRPEAGDDEPYIAVREGSLKFKDALGPLAGVSVAAGGLGLGRDGTIYVLPAGYEMGSAVFEQGAHIELAADQPGGLFGLPAWLPVEVRKLGLQFNGLTDPNDVNQPLRIDNSIFTNPAGVAVPLTDPENFTLTISGGLQGNQVIPLTGDFENIRINLGSLAGCVAVATAGVTGVDLSQPRNYGYIFDSECGFPVEGLDGVVIGVEPIDFGPITVGGTLGLGVFTVERPVDPANPGAGVETRNVFYGIIEGELSAAGYGLGAEIIITQFGPVAGRLKVGVPIPIGTLVGALGGPVGAGLGTASGMILNNLEGGFVFGADPLPVVEDPRDIFTIPAFRTPLRTTVSEVQAKVADLAFENPSFSELIGAFTNAGTYEDILIGLFTGDLSSVDFPPMKFTWEDGFRAVISGTLSNQYAAGVLGLAVTAGVNVGFNFDGMLDPSATAIPDPLPSDWPRHPNGAPAMDFDGVALDPDGNRLNADGDPVDQAVNQTLGSFDDLFGFQFFGFADIDILGTKMAGVGMLMDFTNPTSPVFNLAAALPAEQGLLSLLLPFQGNIGLQVRTDGMLEGTILAALTFIDTFANQSQGFFHDVLTSIDTIPEGVRSPIDNLADRLEADRRFRAGYPLSNRDDDNYDERYDPLKTGYDPDGRFYIENLYLEMLDVDNSGVTSATELDRPITRQFVIDRVLGNSPAEIESILPDVSELEAAGTHLINLASIATKFIEEILVISPVLLQDPQQRQDIVDSMPFWSQIEEQMRSVHNGLTILVDDDEIRSQMEADFQAGLDNALLSAFFSKSLIEIGINAVGGAAAKFVEVIDPSVRIVGQIGPAFLGIPIGRPSNQVDIYLDKNEFRLNGEFSVLSAIFNFIASPAWVNDRTLVDVYFPFENLLADAISFSFPTIDPAAGDWRIGLDSSFNVLGLEISKASGMMFPAGAETLLLGDGTDEEPGKLQLYVPTSTDPILMDKILVRQDHYDENLLPNGGVLMDGRLTLPRVVTDPFTLFAELDQNQDFKDLLADTFDQDLQPGEEPCEGVFNCLIAHPLEAMQLLSKVQEFIGIAASLEEVAQVQLFLPNVFNEGTTIQDAYLVGSYGQWPAPFQGEPVPYPTTSKILGVPLGSGRLNGEVGDNGIDVELVGNFLGLADVRFNFSTNNPGADTFTDANGNGVYDFAEPLTSEFDRTPFGDYNAPEIWTDLNGNGLVDPNEYEDLDGNGRFDRLGDGFIDLNLNGRWDDAETFQDMNGNGVFDPPQMRAGAEFVLGTPPPGCSLPTPELQSAEEISTSMSAFLAQMGFTGAIDEVDKTVGDAFDWIGLSGASAGLCLRAYSPAFDPLSQDGLKKYGGIEATAALSMNDFFEGDFAFSVTPSPTYFLPDVNISAQASSILLPGLEGLSPVADDGTEDPLFGGALGLDLSHRRGAFSGGLTGSIFLFGESLELDADAGLSFYPDGIAGSIGLIADSSMSFGGLTIGGEFSLQFDTRPSNLFAAIAVDNGFLRVGSEAGPLFSVDNASFEIQVGADGLRITNLNADMALFGDNDISFSGQIISTRADGVLIDLHANADLQGISIGPGIISGSASFDVFFDSQPDPGDPTRPVVSGTFDGDGSILGVSYDIITGTVSSDGCIAITDPLAVHFELPGGRCGEANDAGLVINVGDDIEGAEGDPGSGSTYRTIFLEVTAQILTGSSSFVLDVPYDAITVTGALSPDDYRLPGDSSGLQRIQFTDTDLTETIPIEIRQDAFFEIDEVFRISIDETLIDLKSGDAAWFVDRSAADITILNDDDPDFSELLPPLSTLVHFDFDQPRDFAGLRLRPALDESSSRDLGASAPLTTAFETSEMHSSYWPTILSKAGLPTAIDNNRGSVSVVQSNGASDSAQQAPTFFQFTVDPKSGGWLPQGIDFFALGDDASGAPKGWELYWHLDGYTQPILSSSHPAATTQTESISPDWDHHIVRLDGTISATDDPGVPVQGLVCSENPIRFRLQQTERDGRNWHFDNLSLTGKYYSGGCLSTLDDHASEILEFIEQQDTRLPGTFDLDDTGVGVDISFGQDPTTTDPTRYDFLSIELTGTSEATTRLSLLSDGAIPDDQLAPIHITTDGGINALNFDDETTFRGNIEIGGSVQQAIGLGSLADGSNLLIRNRNGNTVTFSARDVGQDVNLTALGPLGNVLIEGDWESGQLVGESAAQVEVAGNLGANLRFQGGVESVAVSGGDLTGSLTTGISQQGDVAQIVVEAVDGVGGSVTGPIAVGGVLHSLSTSGGSIAANVSAMQITSISSTLDTNTNLGGSISGLIEAASVEQVVSTGGDITATIRTTATDAPPARIVASPIYGRGGVIDSPNSFHFAGGISAIVANRISLRVESGGRIEKIIAVDDGPDRPAMLTGRFTASSFGRIETDMNGTANFDLTVTDEAWQRDGAAGFDTIVVPQGSQDWLADQIHLNAGVSLGMIRLIGEPIDTDGDGVPDSEEDAAPGDGDANADGIPDSTQADVASFLSAESDFYVTLVTDAGRFAGVTSIAAQDYPATAPDTILASGLVDFRIEELTTGGSANVQWLLHGGEDVTALLYVNGAGGPSNPLIVFDKDDVDGTGVQLISVAHVTATFREGAAADRDQQSDGILHSIAGAGLADGVAVQNPINRYDVNNDGIVSPIDALKVINLLALIQTSSLNLSLASSTAFYDVNDDGRASALDALNVINFLARQQSAAAVIEPESVDEVAALWADDSWKHDEEDGDEEWMESILLPLY